MNLRQVVGSLIATIACSLLAQTLPPAVSTELSFHPVDIISTTTDLWICGTGEGIANSTDAKNWQIKHHTDGGGALLLGIRFASSTFGYAFGTNGTVLTTNDGGKTWVSEKFGDETILQASFADPAHGLVRTRTSLAYLNGDGALHPLHDPADVLQKFPYTLSLAALTLEKMAVLLSQGPSSEGGILSTTDAGKTWSFYDPPSTGIASFLRVGDAYWASGHEVVDKDKPGGGRGVPLAMSSSDGREWKRSANDIHMCQAQTCGVCKVSGCLASDSLIVNFYADKTIYLPAPVGSLTSKWASLGVHICSIGDHLSCVSATEVRDPSSTGGPQPSEQIPPPLNAKPAAPSILTCIQCSLNPIFVDDKLEGRIPVALSFTVQPDGTIATVEVKGVSSPSLQKKIQDQIVQWLFEPPVQNGKPTQITTNANLNITVMRSQ